MLSVLETVIGHKIMSNEIISYTTGKKTILR